MLLLNTKNLVVGQRVVYQGNVNSSMIRPAEVLRPAVMEAVPSIIVCHNHPSQDPTPSPEDAAITRDLVRGGQAPGCRAAGPHRDRRGALRQPQGTAADALTRLLYRTGAPRPGGVRRPALHAGDMLPSASFPTHTLKEVAMLATHTINPEDLYTISGGRLQRPPPTPSPGTRRPTASGSSRWSAPRRRSRRSGPRCSSSPPTSAHIIKGADGMALSGGYQRCVRFPTRP